MRNKDIKSAFSSRHSAYTTTENLSQLARRKAHLPLVLKDPCSVLWEATVMGSVSFKVKRPLEYNYKKRLTLKGELTVKDPRPLEVT